MNASAALSTNIVLAVLWALAGVLVYGVSTGRKIPLIRDVRAAAVVLIVLGVLMCNIGGIGRAVELYGWSHAITIAGAALGVLAGVLVLSVLLNVKLPLIATPRTAFILLALLIFAKWVIAVIPWGGTPV